MAKKQFVGTKEAAEDMGVSVRTIQKWIRDGKIPSYRLRFGKLFMIERHVWTEWKARNCILVKPRSAA